MLNGKCPMDKYTPTYFTYFYIYVFYDLIWFTVIVHLALKFCMAGLCRYLWSKYSGEKRVTLAWSQYLSRVAVVAVVSGLDIGLSQWSLEYVTLSLYTMTKTTSTPFILFFGLMLRLEKKVRKITFVYIVFFFSINID